MSQEARAAKIAKYLKNWDLGEDYEIVKFLGKGSFSVVAEAVHKPTGTKVAIKKLRSLFKKVAECKRKLREIQIHREMVHPNVVRLFDILEPNDPLKFKNLYLIMELGG